MILHHFDYKCFKVTRLSFLVFSLSLWSLSSAPESSDYSSRSFIEFLKDLKDFIFCHTDYSLFVSHLQLGSIIVDKCSSPPSESSSGKCTFFLTSGWFWWSSFRGMMSYSSKMRWSFFGVGQLSSLMSFMVFSLSDWSSELVFFFFFFSGLRLMKRSKSSRSLWK